jgi:hypothetical protein
MQISVSERLILISCTSGMMAFPEVGPHRMAIRAVEPSGTTSNNKIATKTVEMCGIHELALMVLTVAMQRVNGIAIGRLTVAKAVSWIPREVRLLLLDNTTVQHPRQPFLHRSWEAVEAGVTMGEVVMAGDEAAVEDEPVNPLMLEVGHSTIAVVAEEVPSCQWHTSKEMLKW